MSRYPITIQSESWELQGDLFTDNKSVHRDQYYVVFVTHRYWVTTQDALLLHITGQAACHTWDTLKWVLVVSAEQQQSGRARDSLTWTPGERGDTETEGREPALAPHGGRGRPVEPGWPGWAATWLLATWHPAQADSGAGRRVAGTRCRPGQSPEGHRPGNTRQLPSPRLQSLVSPCPVSQSRLISERSSAVIVLNRDCLPKFQETVTWSDPWKRQIWNMFWLEREENWPRPNQNTWGDKKGYVLNLGDSAGYLRVPKCLDFSVAEKLKAGRTKNPRQEGNPWGNTTKMLFLVTSSSLMARTLLLKLGWVVW